jgi:hypothetical protein
MKTKKILVTGTGRAGTTLLMKLFTDLGLNTGFEKSNIDKFPNEGLENLNLNNDILIHKAPHFSLNIESINDRFDLKHIIIPIRNLNDAASSRGRMGKSGSNGGLWGANSIDGQKKYNSELIYNLIEVISRSNIPFTFIHFPSFTQDSSVLLSKLDWLWKAHGITREIFNKSFDSIVDCSKIHLYN